MHSPIDSESKIRTGSRDGHCFYVIVFNEGAGRKRGHTRQRVETFFARRGLHYYITDTLSLLDEQVHKGMHTHEEVCFVIAGGDGTLRRALEVLWKAELLERVIVAFIPLGSCNMAALSLGLPLRLELALQKAVNGIPRRMNLGLINETHVFFVAAVFGSLCKITALAGRRTKHHFGGLAYLFNAPSLLFNDYQGENFTVRSCDAEDVREVRTHSIAIFNHLKLAELEPRWNIDAENHRLHLMTLHNTTGVGLVRALHDCFFGVIESPLFARTSFVSTRYVFDGFSGPAHLDGDCMALGEDLHFRVVPQAVTFRT